ncbi:MAG: MEKHLA domain-containing protein, partial [Synechococcales cyanobacterium RM1_1_8]|nr:MEKHLA domain-containing protein [Synechococcales cyanobacterium RM1_1_8]
EQPERAAMLAQALARGYFEGYVGDRITHQGQRFRMKDGIIWTVLDGAGDRVGQAATFSRYHFL